MDHDIGLLAQRTGGEMLQNSHRVARRRQYRGWGRRRGAGEYAPSALQNRGDGKASGLDVDTVPPPFAQELHAGTGETVEANGTQSARCELLSPAGVGVAGLPRGAPLGYAAHHGCDRGNVVASPGRGQYR